MRDDLGNLAGLDAILERQIEMVRHLDRLISRDQRRQSHNAAIPRRQPGALPQVAEKRTLRVSRERGRNLPNVVERWYRWKTIWSLHRCCPLRLGAGCERQADRRHPWPKHSHRHRRLLP